MNQKLQLQTKFQIIAGWTKGNHVHVQCLYEKKNQAALQWTPEFEQGNNEAPSSDLNAWANSDLCCRFIFEPAPKETSMVKDGHKLRHHKINHARTQQRRRMGGYKEISRTYVFLQGLSVVLQTYQGGNVKTPRPSQDPTSFLVVRRQPLKRPGLQGSCLLHPVQWKAVKGGGHEVGTTNLKELAL